MEGGAQILSIFGNGNAPQRHSPVAAGAALAQAGKSGDKAAMARAAKEFESIFISQMLEHMFAETEMDGVFGDPQTEDVYRSWMVDQYGKLIVDSGGIGVADHVQKELLKLQESKQEAL